MNYQAFTNSSLTMMYEAIRGALAADAALKRQETSASATAVAMQAFSSAASINLLSCCGGYLEPGQKAKISEKL
jgi:hypothetical protein